MNIMSFILGIIFLVLLTICVVAEALPKVGEKVQTTAVLGELTGAEPAELRGLTRSCCCRPSRPPSCAAPSP